MTVETVLRRQAGVISRAQARAEGMSPATITRRVARGLWLRVHPRVYFAVDHPLTAETRLRAAYLWAGQAATVSGVTAAWWHGLVADSPGPLEITIPHRRRLPAQRGVRVRRSDLHPADRVEINGVWATAIPLTALQTAVALGAKGSHVLDRALHGRITVADLYAAYCRNLGRYGTAAQATLLHAACDRTASEAERIMSTLLRAAGLTGWRTGYSVDGYTLDFAFPGERIAIEVDGWAWHSDVQRFRHDRRRQNTLVLTGWTVLRFTWHDLSTQPDAVISSVRTALTRANAS